MRASRRKGGAQALLTAIERVHPQKMHNILRNSKWRGTKQRLIDNMNLDSDLVS